MKRKKIIFLIITILALGIFMGTVDLFFVSQKKLKPIFSLNVSPKKDGGSGNYVGLGYSIQIIGNFMPENEYIGVQEYKFYILGILFLSNE